MDIFLLSWMVIMPHTQAVQATKRDQKPVMKSYEFKFDGLAHSLDRAKNVFIKQTFPS